MATVLDLRTVRRLHTATPHLRAVEIDASGMSARVRCASSLRVQIPSR